MEHVFNMGKEAVENIDANVIDMSLNLMKVGVLSSMWIVEFTLFWPLLLTTNRWIESVQVLQLKRWHI